MARGFAAAGAELTILATGESVRARRRALSEETGNPVRALVCDITDRAAVAREVGGLGRLDVLVNNAGLERITPILEPGEEVEATFRRIIEINVIGTYYVTREVVKTMEPGGRIVITASVWGRTAAGRFSAYSSLEARQHRLHARHGRRAGPQGHRGQRGLPRLGQDRRLDALALRDRQARTAATSRNLPGRDHLGQAFPGLMEPDDMASTYLFLASDQAANITGQTLNVDRGELMA